MLGVIFALTQAILFFIFYPMSRHSGFGIELYLLFAFTSAIILVYLDFRRPFTQKCPECNLNLKTRRDNSWSPKRLIADCNDCKIKWILKNLDDE